ncbi:MAG: LytTR family DNA-binding domain-containing protein [Flavitalea sp.]
MFNIIQVKINYDEILYIEAMRDYVRIHLQDQKPVITHISMKAIEEKINSGQFVRVHKSYIINIPQISSIKRGVLMVGTLEVPYSENYKEQLHKKLGIIPE